jgi:septal ring factor EnvC (AmiA/AmiB activator)
LLGKLAQSEQDKRTSDTKILDLKTDINKLATEKAAAENRAAILETIPLQATSNLSYLTASQPTNQQRLLILLDAVQILTNAVQALRPSTTASSPLPQSHLAPTTLSILRTSAPVTYVNANTNVSTNQP